MVDWIVWEDGPVSGHQGQSKGARITKKIR